MDACQATAAPSASGPTAGHQQALVLLIGAPLLEAQQCVRACPTLRSSRMGKAPVAGEMTACIFPRKTERRTSHEKPSCKGSCMHAFQKWVRELPGWKRFCKGIRRFRLECTVLLEFRCAPHPSVSIRNGWVSWWAGGRPRNSWDKFDEANAATDIRCAGCLEIAGNLKASRLVRAGRVRMASQVSFHAKVVTCNVGS